MHVFSRGSVSFSQEPDGRKGPGNMFKIGLAWCLLGLGLSSAG